MGETPDSEVGDLVKAFQSLSQRSSWNWAVVGGSGGKPLLGFDSCSQMVSNTGLMLPESCDLH